MGGVTGRGREGERKVGREKRVVALPCQWQKCVHGCLPGEWACLSHMHMS